MVRARHRRNDGGSSSARSEVILSNRFSRTAASAAIATLATLLSAGVPRAADAQHATAAAASPLWGEMSPGPNAVGFKVLTLRDVTRTWFRPTSGSSLTGLPVVVRYWYPAQPTPGRPMSFGRYLAADSYDDQLTDPTAARIATSNTGLKAFYERPQNFTFGAVEPDRWARLQEVPLRAVADAPARADRFPAVVGVGGALGNAAIAEYLASHGYVVAVVGSPAETELGNVARMEWYVRDIELALATLRTLPNVDGSRVATWGFSFAGMPALLAAMRNPDVDAVASLESAIFYTSFMPQMRGNPFYDPSRLRVPFLHMMRASESRANEQLGAIDSLRYAIRYRYLVNDTAIVHQDFGTHGIAAAAVLDKRPHARTAVVKTQRANAEYIRRFLDAHVKGAADAEAWLARSPEENGVPAGLLTVIAAPAVTPAPTNREFIAMIGRDGVQAAMAKFHLARQADPSAPLFSEATVNALGYELLRSSRVADGVVLLQANVEMFPQSANAHDSLAEGYEMLGDKARSLAASRKTLTLLPGDSSLNPGSKANLKTINEQRVQRLGGAP
jgi:dienelactone hydrolase